MPRAVTLQRAEIISVAKLGPKRLEDVPVVLLPFLPELPIHVPHEIGDDTIVVEQRVIDVEQRHLSMHPTSLRPLSCILNECTTRHGSDLAVRAVERNVRAMKSAAAALAATIMLLALTATPAPAQDPGAASSNPF